MVGAKADGEQVDVFHSPCIKRLGFEDADGKYLCGCPAERDSTFVSKLSLHRVLGV